MTLAFRIGRVAFRVQLWFVAIAAILGLLTQPTALRGLAWGGSLLAAVLVHELAHAIAARAFGLDASVNLVLLGPGATSRAAPVGALRRVLICVAGPAASLAVGGAVLAVGARHLPASVDAAAALRQLGWFNLGWGLINLAPIAPLDGGYVVFAVCDHLTRGRGEQPTRLISVAFAIAFGVTALCLGFAFAAFVGGLLALQNARGLRIGDPRQRDAALRAHLDAAYAAAERGDARIAVGHCVLVLRSTPEPTLRRDAIRLLAYSYATSGSWAPFMVLLESGGARTLGRMELGRYERAARELGRVEVAQRIAELRFVTPT